MKSTRIAIACLLSLFAASQNGLARQPNVVVILTDDQGWGDLSTNGNSNLATPHVDSLARDGATFLALLRLPGLRTDACRVPDRALLPPHRRQRSQPGAGPPECGRNDDRRRLSRRRLRDGRLREMAQRHATAAAPQRPRLSTNTTVSPPVTGGTTSVPPWITMAGAFVATGLSSTTSSTTPWTSSQPTARGPSSVTSR